MTTPTYETDFDAWAQQQATALRAQDWAALDLEPLADCAGA
jgi:predicted oxidoreductase (fatty acid repression mutant protein)